ncbi:MAG TPA: methyltransferase domain-containing protein [Burkholderiales bacterium]|nr:methyltransferase domain-containing protein [Burkholderiales bacterium]
MSEWNAAGYQAVSSLQEAMAAEDLARVRLGARDRVLDVGCGNGRITAAIADRILDGSVLGVDPSKNMIDFACRHYTSSTHPNLRFELGDARSLPYRHEFDRIVSFNAVHWVRDQVAVLRSIHAALKPGGEALLRFVPDGPRKCLEDVIEDVCASPRWAQSFPARERPYIHPAPDAYRTLAEQSGLKVERIDVEDKAWDFGSRQSFFDFCHVTFAEWTRFLPEAEWGAFITDVLDRYRSVAASTPAENNTFKFYQMEVLLTPMRPAELPTVLP